MGKDSSNSELTPQQQFAAALARAQSQLGHALKDSNNPHFKSKFADLTSVIDAIREPYAANGFSIMQPIVTEDGVTYVCTTLLHESGHSVESRMPLPMSERAQQVGGFITYWRRYQLQALCGVGCHDDDGCLAQQAEASYAPSAQPPAQPPVPSTILPSQTAYLLKLLSEGGPDLHQRFLTTAGIQKPEDLLASHYKDAIAWIQNELGGVPHGK